MRISLKKRHAKNLNVALGSRFIAIIFILLGLYLTAMLKMDIFPSAVNAYVVDGTITDHPLWPHQKSDLKPDPALIFGKLTNGFGYILMKNQTPKERVSMHLDVQVGSFNEREKERGVAHFLEHMQFNGSTHFKPGELVKYFQRIGMQFGPDANAHTSFSETVYDILLPKGNAKNISDGLLVMRNFADGALLLQSEVDKERKVVLSEMRTRDSAASRIFEASLEFTFPDALLSKRLPIGKAYVLRKANKELLETFYQTWYRPDNMVLIIVGDFDPKIAENAIKEHFSDMKERKTRSGKPDFGKILHKGIKCFYYYEKESGNTTVSIENIVEVERQPDSLALQRKLLIRYLADLIVQNRIDAMLKDPEIPFTSADIASGQYLHKVQYARISAQADAVKWEKSLIKLEKILRKALIYGFLPSELERVKNDFNAGLNSQIKKASTRNSRDLARQIIRHINADRVMLSPRQEKDLFGPILREVTLKEVNAAFRSVWSADHRLVLVTGNVQLKGGLNDPEKNIQNVYLHSLKTAVSAPEERLAVKFPYLPEPKARGQIVSRKSVPDLNIEQIDFTNGLRLNLKKTDFERHQVDVNVAFGYGRSDEPANTPGISELTQAVVNESGLGRLTSDELKAALAGKTSQVSFRVEEEHFLVSGTAVSDELLLLFQLIHTHLVDPGFRETAYRLSLERFRQREQALIQSIEGTMSMSGERFLAGGDLRFGSASYDELKRISLAQIKKWVKKGYDTTPLEISVIGDFDTHEVIALVSRYLGGLPGKKTVADPKRSNKINFPKNRLVQYAVESRIPKSLVVVAYPTDDFWDIHRTRRLSALADLLSERLRVYIREEMGVAYSPYAYNHSFRAYPGYGMLRSQITTHPKQAMAVGDAVKEITQQVAVKPISPDELKRIIDPTVTSIKDLRQTNQYWLNNVLTLSLRHPEQLEWSRTIENDYRAITAGELQKLAQKYFKKETAATVIVVPKR
jgi:zinc protease